MNISLPFPFRLSSDRKLRRLPNRPTPSAMRLVQGLAVLVVLGTLLLMIPGMSVERIQLNQALFTATSALTVTGLSVIAPGRDLTLAGQIVLLCLIQIGGVGFMVGAVVMFRLLGRRITMLDRYALCDSFGLLVPGEILRLTRQVLITVGVIESLGAAALWLHWRDLLGAERAIFYAIFHSVSAFCNAGFDLFGGLPEFPNGVPKDTVTLWILGSLIFIGGLGIPVLTDLLLWHRNRRLSLHTRITLVVIITLIFTGGFGLMFAERQEHGAFYQEPLGRQVEQAFFQAVSVRTAGYVGIDRFDDLTPASQLLLIVYMFIGAAPASMGGGITTGTFAVLLLALWGYARGLPSAQVGGRAIAVGTVRRAAAVLTISLFVVLLATWLILITHDAPLDAALFEVISAFATCGLTLAFTDQLNLFGQIVIVLMMFWGRLGALTIILALAQQRPQKLVQYPEEQLLIG